MLVTKRDNTIEEYDIKKIENVLNLAFQNSNTVCNNNMAELVNEITDAVSKHDAVKIHIENIQNIVEKTLMKFGYFDTAKHYIEYRHARQENRNTEGYISKIPDDVVTPWGMLGYITYKRTYARLLKEDGTTEEYRDTILRILKAAQMQLGVGFTNEELKKAYKYLMSLKCSVAGRFAWQLGTKTVDNLGIMSLQNCAFVKIDEPIKPFLWIFDVLMLGTGVGFSIEKKYVENLPPIVDADIKISRVDTNDADFIVPDSREGWVSLLEKVLEAYFYKGKSFSYSTVLIRSAGSKINGFGGVASGPEDLVKGLVNIQSILSTKKGQKLSTVDCLDIVNIIATVVVAGNVRRCLPGDSLVHTKTGLKQIKDVNVGDEVMTSSGYETVKRRFVQGKQNVITIYTRDGEFKCTPNHRMAVVKSPYEYEWKMAKDIKYNDLLMTTRNSIKGGPTKLPVSDNIVVPELDEYMAWFIGILQSKRPFENNSSMSTIAYKFTKNSYDYKTIYRMKNVLGRFFNDCSGFEIHISEFPTYYVLKFESEELYDYLSEHVFGNGISDYIMSAVYDIRMGYIAGVIDGNEEFYTLKKGRTPVNIVTTDFPDYVTELQALCYSCGFETKRKNDTEFNVYELNAVTNHAIASILEATILHKINLVDSYYNMPLRNVNGFPIEMLKKERKFSDITKNCYKKSVSMNIFDEHFDNLSYCPVSVVRVGTETEFVDTYDIEVNNIHEFYCNGYLTHNSALIALGDCDDVPYLKAKDWSSGNIPNWRCMSNNSVVCGDPSKLSPEFWEGYNGTSEPYGLVNLDLSRKIGRIKDGEKYPDPGVVGYNPCFAAETLIAVADGRGAVPIKQLAEEGKDVPVYSVNEDGMVEIKWGRNPRITGENQKMVKVVLDDGTYVKTTLNHKFRLKDGSRIEAKDLKPKMSLTRFTKTLAKVKNEDDMTYIRVNTDTNNCKKGQFFEHRMIAKFHNPDKFNDMYDENTKNGIINSGVVVHHKDYNGLNNSPDNLQIMSFNEHTKFHGDHDQTGENNGMYGKNHSQETKELIGAKTKERCADTVYIKKLSDSQKKAENNPDLKIKMKEQMKKAQEEGYKKWCEEMMRTTDLETFMENGILHAKKTCENCKNSFNVPFSKREFAYCSLTCSNTSAKAIENRKLARNANVIEKQKEVLHNQIMVYKDLQETLGRDPMKKEWETECKNREVSFRIRHDSTGNEFLLRSYQDLKDKAVDYNHRVKSVEFMEETETVYNITVDDNHTVGIFTTYRNGAGNGIFTPQCGEQSLCNYETCCLAEIYLSNVTSYDELKEIAVTVYRICKHSLLLKCHQEKTEEIVHKNLRMGIGITGYMQASDEQKSWLEPLYEYLREYDNDYSDKHGFPRSIKLTTVKPSGTLSLLAGVTSGCHPAIYQYFIRRIRIASNNPLISLCKSKGYFVEYQRNFDGSDDKNTMIIEFPCCYPIGSQLANEMTAIDQLEVVKHLQTVWSDNSVSCTVYYRLNEIDAIKEWFSKNYTNGVKSCSFLLHNDHGFQQAPFEEITKEKYEEMIKKVEPITNASINIEQTPDYSSECVGGVCPIR